eukprot:s3067_g1.t1
MSRTIVKDTVGDGSAGAGSDKKDPLDDSAEWSDGEPSDDETEQEKKERTVWERSQKEGEQYLPKRLLKGLLPEGLLQKYFIYQQNESPWRADLSFILAWTEQDLFLIGLLKNCSVGQDPRELGSNAGRDPPIHLIDACLSLKTRLLQTANAQFFALLPNIKETAGYLGKLAHVSARSRLPEEGELRTLELCDQIRKCLEIIQNEVEQLRQRWWGVLARISWPLPDGVFGDYEVDPNTELALDNRSKYLERLGGRDGARPGEALTLHCPRREPRAAHE